MRHAPCSTTARRAPAFKRTVEPPPRDDCPGQGHARDDHTVCRKGLAELLDGRNATRVVAVFAVEHGVKMEDVELALGEMCSDRKELGYDLLRQGEPESGAQAREPVREDPAANTAPSGPAARVDGAAAEALVTACANCRNVLEVAIEHEGMSLPVLGLTELVAQYLESDPAQGSSPANA